jgi:hypothetical protein
MLRSLSLPGIVTGTQKADGSTRGKVESPEEKITEIVSGSNMGVQIRKKYEQRQASAAALSAPPFGKVNSIGKG